MIKLGLNCKLYRGPAGTTATTLMTNVRGVTLNMSAGTADITTRAAQGWRANVATLREGTVDTEMLYDPADADFQAVSQAFLTNSPIALFVTDGDGSGFDADFMVSNFSQTQDLESGVVVSVSFTPTLSGRSPVYVQSTGNTLGGSVTVSGTPSVGQTLTAVITSLTPSGAQSVAGFQWFANAAPIDGAIESAYEVAAGDSGKMLSVRVIAPGYAGEVYASASGVVS